MVRQNGLSSKVHELGHSVWMNHASLDTDNDGVVVGHTVEFVTPATAVAVRSTRVDYLHEVAILLLPAGR